MTLTKLKGAHRALESTADVTRRLIALYSAFEAASPDALTELELRSEPLRSQWEARGAGLLAALARLTEPGLIVAEADCILVRPAVGGGGAAHPLYNSLHIEAVLTNPHDALPEAVRMAWFVSQLTLDLPVYHEGVGAAGLRQAWPLAMVPAVLAAAQEVEWARADEVTLTLAATNWLGWADDDPRIGKLSQWWETYRESSPEWKVAVAALDQMLAE